MAPAAPVFLSALLCALPADLAAQPGPAPAAAVDCDRAIALDAQPIENEDDRMAAIDRIIPWTDPGPGGYYDDLGNPAQQPHLVRGLSYEEDPH
jgi:hypothetical protein